MRVVRQEGLNLMTQLFTVNRAKNSRSQGQTKKTRERPTTLHYQKSLCMCTRYTSQSCTKVGQTNTIYQNTQKGRPTILFAKSYKWYFFKRYLNMEQIFIQKKISWHFLPKMNEQYNAYFSCQEFVTFLR